MKSLHFLLCSSLALLASCSSPSSRAAFTQPALIPVLYEQREQYQNAQAWSFDVNGREEMVPAGLIVDGASVPRIAWTFMPPDGLHRAGALAHDWIYLNKGWMPSGTRFTRAEADHVFYNFMRRAGVGPWRAGLAYDAVRLGGWHAWSLDRSPVILPVIRRDKESPAKGRDIFSHIYASPANVKH